MPISIRSQFAINFCKHHSCQNICNERLCNSSSVLLISFPVLLKTSNPHSPMTLIGLVNDETQLFKTFLLSLHNFFCYHPELDIEQTERFQGFKPSTDGTNEPVVPLIKIACSLNTLRFDAQDELWKLLQEMVISHSYKYETYVSINRCIKDGILKYTHLHTHTFVYIMYYNKSIPTYALLSFCYYWN